MLPPGYARDMGSDWRARASRLRWRLRGGTMWATFAAATVADGLLLHYLPPLSSGVEIIPGVIIASFVNLCLLGAIAPWIARRLEARQPAAHSAAMAASGNGATSAPDGAPTARADGPPYEVLLDRVGTAILLVSVIGLVAAGLGSRPLIVSETEATENNARTVRTYVMTHGSEEIRANVDAANTIRIAEGYFRTCIPRNDRRSAWCLFVDTKHRPAEVREDSSATPNEKYAERAP